MDIKGSNFIENIMIKSAYSELNSNNHSFSFKNLEMKIVNLFDSIFTKISSNYQQRKAEFANQIMVKDANSRFKTEPVSQNVENIFSKAFPEVEKNDSSTSLFIPNLEKNKQMNVQTPVKEKESEAVQEDEKTNLETLVEEEKSEVVKEDEKTNLETEILMEEKQPEIDVQAQENEALITEELELEDDVMAFNRYLMENPAALASVLFILKNSEGVSNDDFPDFLKQINDLLKEGIEAQAKEDEQIVELNEYLVNNPELVTNFLFIYLAYAHAEKEREDDELLDYSTEINPKSEIEAEEQDDDEFARECQMEDNVMAFGEYLKENLGALAGFLCILQAAQEENSEEDF